MNKIYYKKKKTRLTKVFNDLRKDLTLKQIGERYGLSHERVRQIANENEQIDWLKMVQVHYAPKIKKMSRKALDREITRLSRPDRRQEIVLQRHIVVRVLRDKFKLNFSEIGKLFKRDHSTIINLYYKEYE